MRFYVSEVMIPSGKSICCWGFLRPFGPCMEDRHEHYQYRDSCPCRCGQDDTDSSDYDEGDGYDSEDEEEENEESTELTKGDIKVSPAKKTIKVGGSFNIEVYPSDDVSDEYADMPDEEWEEILDNNIDNITFKSTKSSVAYVSTKGKVKGKKKGSAIIKTTITFADSSEGIYKTKVYVKR